MKLFGRKQYVLAAIIIVLTLALVVLNSKAQAQDLANAYPVMSKQFGPLTYIIAVEKVCDGVSVPASASRWTSRLTSNCVIKYHHMIGGTGKTPARVAITERMPTTTMMNVMLHKYIRTITQGTH